MNTAAIFNIACVLVAGKGLLSEKEKKVAPPLRPMKHQNTYSLPSLQSYKDK